MSWSAWGQRFKKLPNCSPKRLCHARSCHRVRESSGFTASPTCAMVGPFSESAVGSSCDVLICLSWTRLLVSRLRNLRLNQSHDQKFCDFRLPFIFMASVVMACRVLCVHMLFGMFCLCSRRIRVRGSFPHGVLGGGARLMPAS